MSFTTSFAVSYFTEPAAGAGRTGLRLLQEHFGNCSPPPPVDPSDLAPDILCCATIVIGGRDPDDDVRPEERAALGLPAADVALPARFAASIEALGRSAGRKVEAVACVELGSLAAAATFVAADMLSIPVLNADGTGRSIPELGLSKLDLVGIAATPLALTDRFGGTTLLVGSRTAAMADRMGRAVSRAVWGRGLACAAYPAPLAEFARGLVPRSLDAATRAGRLLSGPGNVPEQLAAIAEELGGTVLAAARIRALSWRNHEPYAFRELDYILDGRSADDGHMFRIFVKNEHHAVWRDGSLVAASPDPIAVLDAATLDPLTTLGEAAEGRDVVILVLPPLDPIWHTDAGRRLLGPERFLGSQTS